MPGPDPSLHDNESRGGRYAQQGFQYQDAYVIGSIPRWLAADGFAQVKQEAMEDVETSFFIPGRGVTRELVQVKNKTVSLTDLKQMIDRFVRLDSGGEFTAFKIVAPNFAERVQPFKNQLAAMKSHYRDYEGTDIGQQSMLDFKEQVVKLTDGDEDISEFLINKVDICVVHTDGDGAYRNNLSRYLPDFDNCAGSVVREGLSRLRHLIHTVKDSPISRKTIEGCLYGVGGAPDLPPIYVAFKQSRNAGQRPLVFDMARFFDFDVQRYPTTQDWKEALLPELKEARKQIKKYRKIRTVRMRKHAISSALAFGWVFSAVAEFEIEIEHNGQVWTTRTHSNEGVPDYDSSLVPSMNPEMNHLVVSIGICKDISTDVDSFLADTYLEQASRLNVVGQMPIACSEQANAIVNKFKLAITEAVQSLPACSTIHLFYAGPIHFAAFLAHRWNALPPAQCYEWNKMERSYLSACQLAAY